MSADIFLSELDEEYPFLNQIAKIRRRSRKHIADGSPTGSCGPDRDVVLRLLDESLATELMCVLRYRRHSFVWLAPSSWLAVSWHRPSKASS